MEPIATDDFYQMIKPQLCGLLDLLRIGVVFDAGAATICITAATARKWACSISSAVTVRSCSAITIPRWSRRRSGCSLEGRPIHSQGSRHELAGRLARELAGAPAATIAWSSPTPAPKRWKPR